MDFKQFQTKEASEEGRFCHLFNPMDGRKLYDEPEDGGNPIKVGIWVYGPTSKRYKTLDKSLRDARMDRLRVKSGGRLKGLGGAEEEAKELYASLCFRTVGISYGPLNGEQDIDKEAMLRLFDEFPWIEDQVKDFIDDDANWMGEQ